MDGEASVLGGGGGVGFRVNKKFRIIVEHRGLFVHLFFWLSSFAKKQLLLVYFFIIESDPIYLLEGNFPYDPVCPSIWRSVD